MEQRDGPVMERAIVNAKIKNKMFGSSKNVQREVVWDILHNLGKSCF